MECDFCGLPTTKEELVVLPVDRFNIPELNYWNFSWGWGGCAECGAFLKAEDFDGLLDRAVSHLGEPIRAPLREIYGKLHEHQNGPLRGWLPDDDEEGRQT